jgi:hypothetical protein
MTMRDARLWAAYDIAPVIADVISVHCPGTSARQTFIRACFLGDWAEAKSMVEGMLAEPWVLRGYQEVRLREFLELLPVPADRAAVSQSAAIRRSPGSPG